MNRDRGQVVLLAAVVVAIALVPMALAYAQLSYDAGAEAPGPDVDDTRRALSASFTDAAAQTDGAYLWRDRERAVSAVRTELASDVARVENATLAADRSLRVTYNGSEAAGWAARNCPGGRGRVFGPCRVEDGVVVQQRGNETAVVAAAFDLRVVAADERTNATVVVRAV
ncbi:DUF7261 family protein [Halogeometricum limi]|uniref:Uncharacterized protein n=1 Tax=Halogeometricum limi TaxID=555875 RepID=A0A1I6G2I4_9EURY|nr:hypothetical protein [Halogeometricum limi]SFR36396.1 hypothetical protein SAMN04488124_0764 [Halogeometricum limi]